MKICPKCNTPAADNVTFCGRDGTRLVTLGDVPPVSPVQPPVSMPQMPVAPPQPVVSSPPIPQPPPIMQPQVYQPPVVPPHQQPPRPQPSHTPPMHDPNAPIVRITCKWCQAMNEKTAVSCRTCGAPLDIKDLVSESGWREAPRIKDMTEIRFGRSTCQVEGEIVPVAEMNLAPGDSIFFEHHVLLWKDDATAMSVMTLQGGFKRVLAGMPFVISIANGPGRVAFSRDATGELVVLPLHPGMELDVREHAFLLASHHIDYSFVRVKGLRNILFGGQGMFMDRFITQGEQGLLILHGYGNVFERTLKAGESIMLEPGAFLYKDSTVTMDVEFQQLTTGWFGGTGMSLAKMTGPGRVGIQSMYVHHNTD